MFDHPDFDIYDFDEIPLDTDLYLRDEIYMSDWAKANIDSFNGKEYKAIGYVSYISANKITPNGVELSWFTNIHDRFHELNVFLPKNMIKACVGAWKWDENPSIFVDSEWLKLIHIRSNCVFGFIDAVGMRNKIAEGGNLRESLSSLTDHIDQIAKKYPQISFISFADSLILKSHWTSGYFAEGVRYTYEPELLIQVFRDIREVFSDVLGLPVYGIFTQGCNEYGEDKVLHISDTENHVGLNCLGAPFADLMSIEDSAKYAFKNDIHPRSELYLDFKLFWSLKLDSEFKATQRKNQHTYTSLLSKSECTYICTDYDTLTDNLE